MYIVFSQKGIMTKDKINRGNIVN